MATTITSVIHQDGISGSPEKRLDVAPDGTLWVAVVAPYKIVFFSSKDNGSTYTYSGVSDLSLGDSEDTAVPSFMIDADGFAHVCWVKWQVDPQVVVYARGVPVSGGGWSWTTKTISTAGGRLDVDSDLVVFRQGTGWVAWVAYTYGSGTVGAKVAKVDISASGALTVATTAHGPSLNAAAYQSKSITFAHAGDGKTPSGSPHLFLAVAQSGSSDVPRWHRAKYQSGTWVWETPVAINGSMQLHNTVLCSVFDGQVAMVAWVAEGALTTVRAAEWDGVAGAVTSRNPPAIPGGMGSVNAVSLAVDPSTRDLYLAAYGTGDYDIYYTKFTRATTTWGAWAVAASRTIDDQDGHVQLVRYPPRDSVDMVYTEGTGPYTIKGQQLLALTRSPSAPVLLSPASGARADLASGYTFKWSYSPVSPGDTQAGFVFRRVYGSGPTTEYWNAATQAWQGTSVVNPTDTAAPHQVSFPAGKWTTGTTYTWSVSTRSSTGADSAYPTGRTVVAALTPTVAVTAPVGIYYGESTPLVQWTYTSVTTQRDYRVRIVATSGAVIDPNDPGPAAWDSGVVTSSIARSARVTFSLSDGIAYRAYVQCTDVNGSASPWMSSDFTLSLQPPSGPLVEVYDVLKFETDVPRLELTIMARSNFLSSAGARGQADWTPRANCSLSAQQDDQVNQLVAGLHMASTGAGVMSVVTSVGSPPLAPPGRPQPAGPLSFPVLAGRDYTGIASLKTGDPTKIRACRVNIEWYDADDGTGTLISTTQGAQVNTGPVAYTSAVCTGTAPEGAWLARMVIEVLGVASAGEVHYASYLSFHPGRDTAYQAGGYADTETLRVERSTDGGATWATVIDRVKPDVYQVAHAEDRTFPLGVETRYRAVTNVDVGDTSSLTSSHSPESAVTVESPTWIIRDLVRDLFEFNALVTGFDIGDDDGSTVFHLPGRESPVIDTEGIRGSSGTVQIYAPGADVDAVIGTLRTTNPLILQSPAGRNYTVRVVKRSYTPATGLARYVDCDVYEVEV